MTSKSGGAGSSVCSAETSCGFLLHSAVWHKIYTLHFGSQWKPKAAGVAALKAGLRHWKEQYLWTVVGQEMNRCRRELRDLSAHTGLPRQTEQVLRY